MSEHSLNSKDRDFEQALGRLQPHVGCASLDRLLFEAGRASKTNKQRPWQVLSGVLGLLLVCSLVGQLGPSESVISVQEDDFVVVTWSPPHDVAPDKRLFSSRDYLAMRRAVLERGVEALPSAQGNGGRAMTVREGFVEQEWH
ncbi:hypothetical protein ACFL6U_00310 [Planctomycetota bacterium]